MRTCARVVVALVIASTTAAIDAQSLADVARKEEARRAGVRAPARILTNASLSPAPNRTGAAEPPLAPPGVAATAAAPGNSSPTNGAATSVTKEETPVLDEKQWRAQAAALRAQLASARKELDAIAGASHADPREQAMLEKIRKERQERVAGAEQQLRSFEARADASQVPPAWLK